eukprot:g21689.t1
MPQRCQYEGCEKWAIVGTKTCQTHTTHKAAGSDKPPETSPSKPVAGVDAFKKKTTDRPKTYIEQQKLQLIKTVGTTEGSLGFFMGQALGVQHHGKSRGLVKATFHSEEDATYHSSKAANKEMAKAFAAMVMATKDQTGNVKFPSKIVAEAQEKKAKSLCTVNSCPMPIFKKGYCVEHTNLFRTSSGKENSHTNATSTPPSPEKNGPGDAASPDKVFSLEALQERNSLPSDIDKTHLEDYLSDYDFQRLFKMERAELAAMAGWKRKQLKDALKLF